MAVLFAGWFQQKPKCIFGSNIHVQQSHSAYTQVMGTQVVKSRKHKISYYKRKDSGNAVRRFGTNLHTLQKEIRRFKPVPNIPSVQFPKSGSPVDSPIPCSVEPINVHSEGFKTVNREDCSPEIQSASDINGDEYEC